MARIRIKLNHDGMEAMLKSEPVADAVEDIAENVAVRAYDNMPFHHTGPLGYEVNVSEGRTRVMAFVNTTHQLAPALERKYAPLRNALEAEG
jgi:hypothetical protein